MDACPITSMQIMRAACMCMYTCVCVSTCMHVCIEHMYCVHMCVYYIMPMYSYVACACVCANVCICVIYKDAAGHVCLSGKLVHPPYYTVWLYLLHSQALFIFLPSTLLYWHSWYLIAKYTAWLKTTKYNWLIMTAILLEASYCLIVSPV